MTSSENLMARVEMAEAHCAVLRQALEKVLDGRCWCAPHPETKVLGHDTTHCEGFIALSSTKSPEWPLAALESMRERCAMALLDPDPKVREHYVLMGARVLQHCAAKIQALPLVDERNRDN